MNNKRLTKDLSLIKQRFLEFQPVSLILYGSYGREEGSWFLDENGLSLPYNDYDILLIFNEKIPQHALSTLKDNLLEKINIRWLDISQKSIKELRNLKPSILNYDLKYASKVIYGGENILDQIPPIDASKLSLEEGNILFKTRMWTFLGSLDKNGLDQDLKGESSRFFRNQMAKAILAIVDILLLQKGAYNSSYRIRVKRFRELYANKKELCLLSEWALNEKLKPAAPMMNGKEVKALYSQVHKYYVNEMFKMLSKRYKIKINKPETICFLWKFYPMNIIKRIGALIVRKTMIYEKKILLDIGQLYLLCAYSQSSIKQKYLNKANIIIKKLNNSVNLDLTWDEARVIVAQMRLN